MNCSNHSKEAEIREFYRPDRKFGYFMNDPPPNYFWYAFRDAFLKKGVLVSRVDNPDPDAPAMGAALLSITDAWDRGRVTVRKSGVTEFTETYPTQAPPLEEKDRHPPLLEQRAHRMMNRLIDSILKDPNFRKIMTAP